MPEALAVLFVFAVVAAVIVFCAWSALKADSSQNLPAQIRQWEQQQSWVLERLEKARHEKWDADMIHSLEDQDRIARSRLQNLAARQAQAAQPPV